MSTITMKNVFEPRITKSELLVQLGLKSIDTYIFQRQLRWVGHVSRLEFDRLPRKMLSCLVKNRVAQL